MAKKITILVFGIFLTGSIMAQDHGKNIIKTNPLALAFGSFNLTYEMAFSDAMSFQVKGNFFNRLLGTEVSGFGVDAGVRYYITNKNNPAPEGFYVGPKFGYNSFEEELTGEKASTIGIGGLVGYQWIFDVGVTLDLGVGPTYLIAGESSTNAEFSGIIPNLSFAVGYNF